MKLSFIFELLLIFILLAFAASAAVLDSTDHHRKARKTATKKHGKVTQKRQGTTNNTMNRFCTCSMRMCNCCREFNIPVLPLKGPGCASLQYLKGDKLAISMSFGDRVLTNTTISGRRPQPVCMPLPGGVSKFCGRVYNIGREGNEFNACLGLELRALNEVEAALRVSCFRFGPKGLRLEPPQPLPILEDEDDDDDDDDDDDFDYDAADSDYGSFSVLDDDFIGEYFQGEDSDSSSTNKKKVTTTKAPFRKATRKPVKSPQKKPLKKKVTSKPDRITTTPKSTSVKNTTIEQSSIITNEVVPSNMTLMENTKMVSNNTQDIVVTEVANNETIESTTQSDANIETTTIQVTTASIASTTKDDDDDDDSDESSEEDEDDDDDDPIAEIVGDTLDDEESVEKIDKATDKTPKEPTKAESKELLDDIVDGVVDTIAGESDESRMLVKGKKGRQSRDMQF